MSVLLKKKDQTSNVSKNFKKGMSYPMKLKERDIEYFRRINIYIFTSSFQYKDNCDCSLACNCFATYEYDYYCKIRMIV